MTFATWWHGFYSDPNSDISLGELADTGANWISLIATEYQSSISSTTIYPTDSSPTDADLIHAINTAHSLGLSVMLKPHIDLNADPDHWRGEIGMYFEESDWDAWFASYQSFIYHYAELAQAYGVEQFCVGTELTWTQDREDQWREIIAGVKSRYNGPMTYAANHGTEPYITWWDALDYIGVDAYYRLTDSNDPSIAELVAAWQPRIEVLADLSEAWDKDIIFTEIGYRSLDGANRQGTGGPENPSIDMGEQADTYEAAFQSVYNQTWLAGIYWWTWEPNPDQGGPCCDGYPPHDKPAENVLRRWYGAPELEVLEEPTNVNQVKTVYSNNLDNDWQDRSWSASVNFHSNSPVFSGSEAIAVSAQAWGALAFHHPVFDTSPYQWLEFYVLKSFNDQELRVFFYDENDQEMTYRRVDNCRYTDGEAIQAGEWTRVRIPLDDLEASGVNIQGMAIKNYISQGASFWVDEIRLIGSSTDPVTVMYFPQISVSP